MGTIRSIVAAAAGVTLSGFSAWHTADLLDMAVQPAQQPAPRNPQPSPQNPQPGPQHPQPGPQSPQPGPQNPTPRPGTQNPTPNSPVNPRIQPGTPLPSVQGRAVRPFAFQSPDMEAQFNTTTRRLVQMEARLRQSHEELLKRLGQVRQMSGERQTNALFDVIQQMLRNDEELQRYLVESRTAWTGEIPPEADNQAAAPTGSQNDR